MEAEIIAEETWLQLKDETWASDANNIDALIESALQDFPDEKPTSEKYQGIQSAADEIAQRCITDKTCAGHLRIIRAFIVYMLVLDQKWSPNVTAQSPLDVCAFITKKCGALEKGYEGKKFAKAVSIWAALTYFAGFTGLCPHVRGAKLAARRPGARANGAALHDATFRLSVCLAHHPSLISTHRTSTKLVRHAASGQVRSGQIRLTRALLMLSWLLRPTPIDRLLVRSLQNKTRFEAGQRLSPVLEVGIPHTLCAAWFGFVV
ncbi:hypothetical protein K439DRAFT_1617202 [Ramaria rubella]|nr:hypothetical protein K439DRAFT_1617202 [Ramaria rubella]